MLLAVGVLLPVTVSVVLAGFRESMANTNAALLLVLVVVAAASFGSRAAGLAAAAICALAFDFFLTMPYGQLRIHSAADVQTTVLLLVIGVAVSELAWWGRRQQARASEQRGYLDGVLATTASLAEAAPVVTVIEHVETQLVTLLDLDTAEYVPAAPPDAPVLRADGALVRHGRVVDVDRSGLPTDTELVLPVRVSGTDFGAFRLVAATHRARPPLQQRRLAALLAEQVGQALREEAAH